MLKDARVSTELFKDATEKVIDFNAIDNDVPLFYSSTYTSCRGSAVWAQMKRELIKSPYMSNWRIKVERNVNHTQKRSLEIKKLNKKKTWKIV